MFPAPFAKPVSLTDVLMNPEQIIKLACNVLEIEADTLLNAREKLGGEFVRAVHLIHTKCPPGKVVVMGIGKSGHVGHKIAATLASTGTPAFFVHPTEAGHGDLGMISSQDVVLAISSSGKTAEILTLFPYFKRNAICTIALSGDPTSPIASHADISINASPEKEACPLGLTPTSSSTLAISIGDALSICLLTQRGFTSEHFANTHPHSFLGRQLLVTVGDIMLKENDVPSVLPQTSIRDSLVEMSRGGIGITSIVDNSRRVLGIFTDGDLRRTLDSNVDIIHTPIWEVMTTAPRSMRSDQLAAEAAGVMEQTKVTAILVADNNNQLVGALNMRMLLSAGVI